MHYQYQCEGNQYTREMFSECQPLCNHAMSTGHTVSSYTVQHWNYLLYAPTHKLHGHMPQHTCCRDINRDHNFINLNISMAPDVFVTITLHRYKKITNLVTLKEVKDQNCTWYC